MHPLQYHTPDSGRSQHSVVLTEQASQRTKRSPWSKHQRGL